MVTKHQIEIGVDKKVSPIVPTPTLGTHAVNKDYVDNLVDSAGEPFVTKWNVLANDEIILPIGTEGVNNVRVDWGDGTVNNEHSHVYTTAGSYDISISGVLEDFSFNSIPTSKDKITEVVQWGDNEWVVISFFEATNLSLLPTNETPDFLKVSSLRDCFRLTNITEVPAGLLDKAINCVDFIRLFKFCQNLETAPDNLFRYCSSANLMNDCFFETKVKPTESLLNGLFNVTVASGMFRTDTIWDNADKISILPERLLWQMPNLESASHMFYGQNILEIPENFFLYTRKINIFSQMFRWNENLGGRLPELWLQFPNALASNTFQQATGADNFSEVPEYWGGNTGVPMPVQQPVQLENYWNPDTNQPQWRIDGVWKDVVGSGSSITNITEIPNRSYNDLQDLPTIYNGIESNANANSDIEIPRTNANNPIPDWDWDLYRTQSFYAHGTSALSWDLGSISDFSAQIVNIINKSTQILTLTSVNTNNEIWEQGTESNSITIAAGESVQLANGQGNWCVRNRY